MEHAQRRDASGFGDGPEEIEGETMLDQFLDHVSVRTGSLADWIDAVCTEGSDRDKLRCRTQNGNNGFTLNGIEATDETLCYVNEILELDDWRHKRDWLPNVRGHWFDEKWADECAPEDEDAQQFWLDG